MCHNLESQESQWGVIQMRLVCWHGCEKLTWLLIDMGRFTPMVGSTIPLAWVPKPYKCREWAEEKEACIHSFLFVLNCGPDVTNCILVLLLWLPCKNSFNLKLVYRTNISPNYASFCQDILPQQRWKQKKKSSNQKSEVVLYKTNLPTRMLIGFYPHLCG